jgi:hypothetical protein
MGAVRMRCDPESEECEWVTVGEDRDHAEPMGWVKVCVKCGTLMVTVRRPELRTWFYDPVDVSF